MFKCSVKRQLKIVVVSCRYLVRPQNGRPDRWTQQSQYQFNVRVEKLCLQFITKQKNWYLNKTKSSSNLLTKQKQVLFFRKWGGDSQDAHIFPKLFHCFTIEVTQLKSEVVDSFNIIKFKCLVVTSLKFNCQRGQGYFHFSQGTSIIIVI